MSDFAPVVDNSISQAPANAAPEVQAAPAPTAPTFEPGTRTPEVLSALLDGADPAQLFSGTIEQPTEEAIVPPITQPVTVPPVIEPGKIPDKFKNEDGSLNADALLKSNRELEAVLGRQGDELGRYRGLHTKVESLEGLIQGIVAGQVAPPQGQPQPPAAPEPEKGFELTPELRSQLEEEFIDDPVGLYTKLIELQKPFLMKEALKEVQPILDQVKPVIEEQERNQVVQNLSEQMLTFAENNPDWYDLKPAMKQIVQRYPHLETVDNAVEIIYQMAKGFTLPPVRVNNPVASQPVTPDNPVQPQQPTQPLMVEDMLKDPATRAKILADPEIKAEMAKALITNTIENAPPIMLGNQPGGIAPIAPQEKPKSVREASGMLSRFLKSQ